LKKDDGVIGDPAEKQQWGTWDVTIERTKSNGKKTFSKLVTFCGMSGDTFTIKARDDRYCKQNHGTQAQNVFDHLGLKVAPTWFCVGQGTVAIASSTFTPDVKCDGLKGEWGRWTVERKCDSTGKTQVDTFCGARSERFKIGEVKSQYCKKNFGTKGWGVLDASGEKRQKTYGWYCTNECRPKIKKSTFEVDPTCEGDGASANNIDIESGSDEDETECPDGLPAVNKDGDCQDIPNPWMKDKGTSCEAGWIKRKRCDPSVNTHVEYWNKCQFCAQTCHLAGFPYKGLNCTKKS
jgi:hypothetical protein